MAVEVVRWDEVLQRDGDGLIEAAGFGGTEHRQLRLANRQGEEGWVGGRDPLRRDHRRGASDDPGEVDDPDSHHDPQHEEG